MKENEIPVGSTVIVTLLQPTSLCEASPTSNRVEVIPEGRHSFEKMRTNPRDGSNINPWYILIRDEKPRIGLPVDQFEAKCFDRKRWKKDDPRRFEHKLTLPSQELGK